MSNCAICGKQTQLVYKSLGGYRQGSYYDIYFCSNCDASYAEPLEVDENLYDTIYSKARLLPGYDRYYRFAEDVLKVKNPLEFLAEAEDTYWAIYDYVSNQKLVPNPAILEVGCGLGYLTYALVKSGYDVRGIDISENAIREAVKKYGSHYECADVYNYTETHNNKFDIIILTEVIEHIPDPLGFISALKGLLSDKGRILITTPNKDEVISQEPYWDTELPPVHLWWFSKKSFQNMSYKLNLNLTFTDFTAFQSKIREKRPYNLPWRQQTLSADGNILFSTVHNSTRYNFRRSLINYNLLSKWQYLKSKVIKVTLRDNLSVSDRLCAILSKDSL